MVNQLLKITVKLINKYILVVTIVEECTEADIVVVLLLEQVRMKKRLKVKPLTSPLPAMSVCILN